MNRKAVKFYRPKYRIKASGSYRKYGVLRGDAPKKRRKIKTWIYSGIIIAAALPIWLASRADSGFAEFFSLNIYPYFAGTIARIFGWIPFSIGEFVLYGAALLAIGGIAYHIIKTIKEKRPAILIDLLRRGVALLATIFFLLTMNCLAGYNRFYFSEYSGLTLRKYSKDELVALTEALIVKANYYSELIETDGENVSVCNVDIQSEAVAAMTALGGKYSVLNAYYPLPKPVLSSKIMSYCNLAGIYFPFTVEANYNNDMPDSRKPFTVCHELSHLTGFLREEEANYIAFLACRCSETDFFRYSGYVDALTYCLNSCVGSMTTEGYIQLYGQICGQVRDELAARNRYWDQFKTPVAEVSVKINDTYLKVNKQNDGEKSYGRVVDLMIAEYLANGEV